jgi:hypothetical protein
VLVENIEMSDEALQTGAESGRGDRVRLDLYAAGKGSRANAPSQSGT